MSIVARAAASDVTKATPRRRFGPERRRETGGGRVPRVGVPGRRDGRTERGSRDSLTKIRTIGDVAERARTDAERSVSRSAKRLALELDVRAREAAERFAAGATDSAFDSALPACFAEEILLFDGWKKRMDEFWRESAGEWSTVGSERDAELARIKRVFEERESSDSDSEWDEPEHMDLPRPERESGPAERDQ